MGKKEGWFSAIKKVFTPNSKEKLANDSEKKSSKAKKKGIVRRETSSFLPIFREPSSIEKILGDVEREQLILRPPTPRQQPITPTFVIPRVASPRVASPRNAPPRVTSPRTTSPRVTSPRAPSPRITSPRAASQAPRAPSPRVTSPRAASPAPRAASPRVTSPRAAASPAPRAASPEVTSPRAASPTPRAPSPRIVRQQKPEPTQRHQHASAIKIQSAYRGYMARRSFKARKGLVRLQGVMRGKNTKRQTANAMKCMQLLVRVQSQVQSRRIRMLENQARGQGRNEKGTESALGKLNAAGNEDWDCSLLTKEEAEARLQRKVEAVVKRERAMAFAYSNKLWKETPRSAQTETLPGGFPWWWNWLEQQLPAPESDQETRAMKTLQLTPPSGKKASPRPESRSSKKQGLGLDNNFDSTTPKSSRSNLALPCSTRNLPKYSRTRIEAPFDLPARDDESLTSCPPFSARGYMAPTASARAKARASSNPRERFPGTPGSETTESRRVSFPVMVRGVGGFKGSFFSNGDVRFRRTPDRQSLGNLSVDSTVSLPAGVGRRPFNRFV